MNHHRVLCRDAIRGAARSRSITVYKPDADIILGCLQIDIRVSKRSRRGQVFNAGMWVDMGTLLVVYSGYSYSTRPVLPHWR